MSRRVAVVVAVVGALAMAACSTCPDDPGVLRRAQRALEEGNRDADDGRDPMAHYRVALDGALTVIRCEGPSRDALVTRAGIHGAIANWEARLGEDPTGSFVAGVQHASAAIERDPMHAAAWRVLAWLKVNRGLWLASRGLDALAMYEEAMAIFGGLVRESPDDPGLRRDRGRVRLDHALARAARGEDPAPGLERAIADLTVALAGLPDEAGIYRTRAGTFLNLAGRVPARRAALLERALADADAAVRLDPDDAYVRMTRGMVEQARGRHALEMQRDPFPSYRRAIVELQRAVAIDPDRDPETWKALGDTFFLSAEAEHRAGGDPRVDLRGALEAYGQAIRRRSSIAAAVKTQVEFCRKILRGG